MGDWESFSSWEDFVRFFVLFTVCTSHEGNDVTCICNFFNRLNACGGELGEDLSCGCLWITRLGNCFVTTDVMVIDSIAIILDSTA